jgi:hypothetical protein
VSRDDGRFELLADEPGPASAYLESLDGKTQYGSRPVEIPDADTHTVSFDVPASQITGVVVDKDTEQPISDAWVSASPKKGGGGASGGSAADGRFALQVEPGEYQLAAGADGHSRENLEVTVSESAASDVRVELPKGGIITGKVVDAYGSAVPQVAVTATSGPEGTAGSTEFSLALADGSFRFDRLRDKPYNLLAGSSGSFAMRDAIQPATQNLTLRLLPGGSVRVTVLAPDGGPVPGAYARLSAVGGAPVLWMGGGNTSEAGVADLQTPAGLVEITVQKGKLKGKAMVAVPAAGAATAEVRLREDKP